MSAVVGGDKQGGLITIIGVALDLVPEIIHDLVSLTDSLKVPRPVAGFRLVVSPFVNLHQMQEDQGGMMLVHDALHPAPGQSI